MLFDPGGVLYDCPFTSYRIVLSSFWTPSATSDQVFNEALSLQPDGLRPTISLSTLNPRRYQCKLKTRYGVCWVSTSQVALSATSNQALRGAPKITPKLSSRSQKLDSFSSSQSATRHPFCSSFSQKLEGEAPADTTFSLTAVM